MRRICLLALLFIFLPNLSVKAETFNISIKSEEKTYKNKEIANIFIEGNGIPNYGVASGQFYINYEPNYYNFSCDDIEYKQNIQKNEIDCNDNDGKIIIIYIDDSVGRSPLNNGELFKLSFKVKTKVKSNTTFSLRGEGFAGVVNNEIKDLTLSSNINQKININLNNNNSNMNIFIIFLIMIIILFFSIFIIKKMKRRILK